MGEDEPSAGKILEVLGDTEARRILEAVDAEPKSAKQLGEGLDLSLPTVYRRLETLDSGGFVTSRTLIAENGNHYKVYECNFESTVVTLEDGTFDVELHRKETLPERFSSLWEELGGEH